MSTQPPEQPDPLEQMFSAEESAIRDDGFTNRVMEQAHTGIGWRRTIIYGAGMAGFGAATASIVDMAPHLPRVSGWFSELSGVLQSSSINIGDVSPVVVLTAAVLAGVSFLALAVAAQER